MNQILFQICRLDDWRERSSHVQRAGEWVHQDGQRSTSLPGDQGKSHTSSWPWSNCTDRQCSVLSLSVDHQEDCSQQDAAVDEVPQKSVDLEDLDDLDLELKDQEDDQVDDGIASGSYYLSQSRSISHLSRLDTHRVRDMRDSSTPYISTCKSVKLKVKSVNWNVMIPLFF